MHIFMHIYVQYIIRHREKEETSCGRRPLLVHVPLGKLSPLCP